MELNNFANIQEYLRNIKSMVGQIEAVLEMEKVYFKEVNPAPTIEKLQNTLKLKQIFHESNHAKKLNNYK
jgi:hypothetical protein